MEGFTKFKKVQCFKEGGTVQRKIENFEKRERKVEEKDDMAQDKKVVKKAFSIHDKQQHEEKTDLSKLKKGGRAKKDKGTVKKFKAGGEVTNVYGAKKDSGDKDNIKKVKDIKAVKLCGGKSVKKMADGRLTGAMGNVSDIENLRMMERAKRARKYLGPAQQSEFVNQGGMAPAPAPMPAPAPTIAPTTSVMDQLGTPTGMPARKRGGKVCK
jgi:hypothetical protein